MPPPKAKLALLICDTPVPAVVSQHGTYLEIFRRLLRESYPLAPSDQVDDEDPFTLDGFDVVNKLEYPDLESGGYKGVLISGSAASAYDPKPWIDKLVDWVGNAIKMYQNVRFIGICFGHQIIARAMGGTCVPNGGKWEVGTTDIELTDAGKEVFGMQADSIAIQQMHRDHVPDVPPSFYLLGSTPQCLVHGLALPYQLASPSQKLKFSPPNIHVLTLQGHPEFTPSIVSHIIDTREKTGAMNAEVVKEGRERAGRKNDGVDVIGRVVWEIFGVGI